MPRARIIRLVLIAALLTGVAALAPRAPRTVLPVAPTPTAPSIDLASALIARGTSGPSVGRTLPVTSLTSFEGQPVPVGPGIPTVLLFFRANCVSCPDELAGLAAVTAAVGGRVRCIGVSMDADPAAAEALVRSAVSEGLVEATRDLSATLIETLSISDAPTTVVADATGEIVADWREPVGMRILHTFIRQAGLV